ncbi:MAG: hypothetical protein ACFFAS_18650 [Promethearchaeota archaeon]
MIPVVPVIYTKNFLNSIKKLSSKEQNAIKYNLEHQTEEDVARVPYYKGTDEIGQTILRFYKKFKVGRKDYRIMLVYCAECYPDEEMRNYHDCSICDGENLERIIVFHFFLRPKAYNHRKFKLPDFKF